MEAKGKMRGDYCIVTSSLLVSLFLLANLESTDTTRFWTLSSSGLHRKRSEGIAMYPLTCRSEDILHDFTEILRNARPSPPPRLPLRQAVLAILGNNAGGVPNPTFHKHDELFANFPLLDENLLSPHGLDFILLYDFPLGSELQASLINVFEKLSWARSLQNRNMTTLPDGDWRTQRGSRVVVKARSFELPIYIQQQPDLLERPDWLGCHGRRNDVGYNLYSGAAFAHHIFFEPLLDEFDYVIKVDLDIRFMKPAPEAPAVLMNRQGCVFLHSRLSTRDTDCHDGAFEATLAFTSILDTAPASQAYDWCRNAHYFFGNFIALDLRYFASPAQLYFSRWLYECVEDGYFRRRWTDQATPPQKLCLFEDIPDARNSSVICSFEAWRDNIFVHG